MAHALFLGMTESGKTRLAQKVARQYQKKGIKVAVLDPLNDPEWNADFMTRNKREFLEVVKSSRQCAIFVDEAGESVGRYDDEMLWLATRGRHYGHSCHFLSQRGTLVSRTVRDQCRILYLFAVSKSDAKDLSNEYAKEELKNANELGRGEFFIVRRFENLQKGKILNFSTMATSVHTIRSDEK